MAHAHETSRPRRRRAHPRPSLSRGTVTASLLHGLAVVRRGRLSARLRDNLRTQGTIFTATFVLAIGWFVLNLRTALSSIGDLRRCSRRAKGSSGAAERPAAARSRHKCGGAARSHRRSVTRLALGDVADVAVRAFLLGSRIRFSIETSGSTSTRCPSSSCCAAWVKRSSCSLRSRRGALYLVSGSLSSGFPGRLSMTPGARRHLSLLVAVFLCS